MASKSGGGETKRQSQDESPETSSYYVEGAGKGAKRSFENTQPFSKEIFGRKFVFAHNGFIPKIFQEKDFHLVHHIPLGKTDSEHIFCFLLDRIKEEVDDKQKNDSAAIARILNYYALKISKLGDSNFLMSDSKYLYTFRSNKLYSAQRNCVCRTEDLKGEPLSVKMGPACPTENQHVRLIATVPLTKDHCWQPLALRKIIVFHKGMKVD